MADWLFLGKGWRLNHRLEFYWYIVTGKEALETAF
jgi:hypothetical protein